MTRLLGYLRLNLLTAMGVALLGWALLQGHCEINLLTITAISCLLASAVLGFRRHRLQLESINRLTAATKQAAKTQETPFVAEDGDLAKLASAMNRMFGSVSTRQQQLRESAARLSTVLGAMVEGVLAVDDRQRVLFANDAAGHLLGFDPVDARGKGLLEVARNHMLHEAVTEALANREQPDQETRRYEFDSHRTHGQVLSFGATRLQGDPCPGVVLVLQDVTELRRLEHLRQEFVANVSHELKTPLSAIQAYAETLEGGAIDKPIGREFTASIRDEADRLDELIMDMLRLAKIESGHEPFDLQSVNVLELVSASIKRHRAQANRKEIEIVAQPSDESLEIRGDKEGLTTIVDNLLDNALKYTDARGSVTVSWQQSQEMVAIHVSDTGVGIPADLLPRVFERFFRTDPSRSRETRSTGLGLAIVKHLSQSFGGSVDVTSELGVGSTFTVTLPKATPSASSSAR